TIRYCRTDLNSFSSAILRFPFFVFASPRSGSQSPEFDLRHAPDGHWRMSPRENPKASTEGAHQGGYG
ncbi:MAG: hypothetical protein ACHBMF_04295, partial [Chromatiales bacterium]